MISTRIKRGAVRTHLLIRKKLENYNSSQVKRSVSTARSLTLSLVAFRMVTLPIPMAGSTSPTPLVAGSVENEPPSIIRVDDTVGAKTITTLALPDGKSLTISSSQPNSNLNQITVGQSLATQNELEQRRVEAENAERERIQKEEQARLEVQRQELARQEAVRQEAARKAAEAIRVVAAVPQPVVQNSGSGDVRSMVQAATIQAFGEDNWPAMASIISRESGFNPNALNRSSGACGLFQALPCSKMGGMEVSNQIRWGIGYIRARYGTPNNAWNFWLAHHWY